MRAWVCAVALCVSSPGSAFAHLPFLARDLVLAPGGEGIAVRLPSVGIVLREHDGAPFEYACDGLLGLSLADDRIAWAYRSDGSLLIGAASGLSVVPADGCGFEAVADLTGVPIAALTVSESEPAVVYAATAGTESAVYRSEDGGLNWERRAGLPAGSGETALRIDGADANVIYVSRATGLGTSAILRSDDGGSSFETAEQDRELALLYVEPGPGGRLWARTRDAKNAQVVILTAAQPAGPWREMHRVRFFGGFAAAVDGSALWVGDEAGGLFRSRDGGEHFEAIQFAVGARPPMAVACLVHARDALWACTPGLKTERAVAVSRDGGASFENVVAFSDVDRMVDCGAEHPVSYLCEEAWYAWRADFQSDAGLLGPIAPTTAGDAALVPEDAGREDGAASDSGPGAAAPSSGGCTVAARSRAGPIRAGLVALLALASLSRIRERTRRRRPPRTQGRCACPCR